MISKREYYTTVQWSNVLIGLSIVKAEEELRDTTLKLKVGRFNHTDCNVLDEPDYLDSQRYIYVAVIDYRSRVLTDYSIITDVMYIGL